MSLLISAEKKLKPFKRFKQNELSPQFLKGRSFSWPKDNISNQCTLK